MIELFKQLQQKSVRLFVMLALLAMAAMVGMPAPASAASPDGYWGQIKSGNSLPGAPKCLTTQGADGRPVYQNVCWNDSWGLWHMRPTAGSDYYFEIVSQYDGHCLDVYAFTHANDGKVTTWPCLGYTNQQWHPSWLPNGKFALKPRHSENDWFVNTSGCQRNASGACMYGWTYGQSKCLDVYGFSHNNGFPNPWNNGIVGDGRIVQWDCYYGVNQQWSYDGSWQ